MSLTEDATQFNWMLNNFVKDTSGVTDAVAVSSDGLLMAMSNTLDPGGADQVAAIISGFVSLGQGTTRCFGFGDLDQIIVAMKKGFLFVTAMGTAGCLGVVTSPNCDMGNVGYQMSLLVERAGQMLTPELVNELKNLVLAGVSEQPAQAAGHDFVRPFIMTRGRTKTTRTDLRFETLVQRIDDGPIDAAVPSEQVAILNLATHAISVAELAAELHLVIGVVTVLINDLLDSDMLVMHADGGFVDDDAEFDMLSRIANKIRTL